MLHLRHATCGHKGGGCEKKKRSPPPLVRPYNNIAIQCMSCHQNVQYEKQASTYPKNSARRTVLQKIIKRCKCGGSARPIYVAQPPHLVQTSNPDPTPETPPTTHPSQTVTQQWCSPSRPPSSAPSSSRPRPAPARPSQSRPCPSGRAPPPPAAPSPSPPRAARRPSPASSSAPPSSSTAPEAPRRSSPPAPPPGHRHPCVQQDVGTQN